jgi:hypothetical protein
MPPNLPACTCGLDLAGAAIRQAPETRTHLINVRISTKLAPEIQIFASWANHQSFSYYHLLDAS